MKQSELFTKTIKEDPKDEESVNAKLLIRAGFVRKLMAGVYSFLPLGFRVLRKIEAVIREEMNNISAQEVLLPALHPKEIWERTNRWKYKEMFKLKNRSGKEFSLGWTHEELIAPLVKSFTYSYRDLPIYVYQIQDKFRDEFRAKSGLLRGVEFLMKDLYSFHKTKEGLDNYYQRVKGAYFKIFKRCGIKDKTIFTLASGGTFSKYSHEFQTITSAGEDIIYVCPKCNIAVNREIIKEQDNRCPKCGNKRLKKEKSIEVGNIFKQQDKFTRPFDFKFQDKDGSEKIVLMGAYGIGLGRLMGAVVEIHHDKDGIIWPWEIAPFQVHLLSLGDNSEVIKESEKIYGNLRKDGWQVLYDDRKDSSSGEKLVDCDLIGTPLRLVLSEKTFKKKQIEVKRRREKKVQSVKINGLRKFLKESVR